MFGNPAQRRAVVCQMMMVCEAPDVKRAKAVHFLAPLFIVK
jgi:hypothetical protein